jgi:protein TonB
MLAYAANRPDPAGRRSSPNVMLVILVAHIAAIAALMSAKTEIVRIIKEPPLIKVPIDTVPPPIPTQPTKPTTQPRNEWPTHPTTSTPQPLPQPPIDLGGPTTVDPGPVIGSGTDPMPQPPIPLPLPLPTKPILLTPASQLRPPYPEAKLLNEEEADLQLRLSIGADGRVRSVDPVSHADPVFLAAARTYLIAHWRYRPATIDGRAVATTTVITLSFRLDG